MWAAGPSRMRRQTLKVCVGIALCAGLLPGMAAIAAAATAGSVPAPAPAPAQPIRIPLEPLGFQPVLEDFLLTGATGLTVDFVDNDHLLITFNTRHLLKREPDQQPDDEDRTVAAVLLELPSGKPLARTEWRLHDQLQYLWNLGHGRFLLRVRDRLTLLEPLRRLADGDAFRGTPVLDVGDRHIVAMLVSSDQDLLTLETTPRLAGPPGSASDVTFADDSDGGPVQINFYRLNDTPEGFIAQAAGVVRAPGTLAVPMTTAGILDVLNGGKDRWLFNFNEHAGKVDELAEWDTTCSPRAMFVAHGEFVAFGCRGGDDRPEIAGFNIKGEQMWEQGLYESFVSPEFAFAPAAGRFALERTIVSGDLGPDASVPAAAVIGEEVRVYQTETGKILLKVNCSPVERAGENFALSPDGMRLAVFEQARHQRTTMLGDPYTETATSLVIYPLPDLTDQDRAAVKEMEAKAPADTGARIDASLARMSNEDASGAVADRTASNIAVPASVAKVLGPPPAAAASTPTSGAPNTANASANVNAADTANASANANVSATDSPNASANAQEPGNPAMTGQLPDAPSIGSPAPNAADASRSDGAAQSAPRRPPTLYEPGENPQQQNTSR